MTTTTQAGAGLPPVGSHVEVGGRLFYLLRSGNGPSVVFLPGAGGMGLSYYNLQQLAGEFATSVLYDRAGTGWSDPIALPRTAKAVVEELRTVLRVASVPAPYLFVGHSLGGFYARRYAQLWPDEVAGLLMLDSTHEDYASSRSDATAAHEDAFKGQPMPEFSAEQLQTFRPMVEGMYPGWPAPILKALVDRHTDPARFPIGLLEAKNIDELNDEIRSGGPIPPVPMIVITALGIDDFQRMWASDEIIQGQNAAKRQSHEILVRSHPGAEHRILEDASHVKLVSQRPDAVTVAIRDLIARAGTIGNLPGRG